MFITPLATPIRLAGLAPAGMVALTYVRSPRG
jgi:hypothetical protein